MQGWLEFLSVVKNSSLPPMSRDLSKDCWEPWGLRRNIIYKRFHLGLLCELYVTNVAYERNKSAVFKESWYMGPKSFQGFGVIYLGSYPFFEISGFYRPGPIRIQGLDRVWPYLHTSLISWYIQDVGHSQTNLNKSIWLLCFPSTSSRASASMHPGSIKRVFCKDLIIPTSIRYPSEFQKKGLLDDFSEWFKRW